MNALLETTSNDEQGHYGSQVLRCIMNTPGSQSNNDHFKSETENTASETVTSSFVRLPAPPPVAAFGNPKPTATLRNLWPCIAPNGPVADGFSPHGSAACCQQLARHVLLEAALAWTQEAKHRPEGRGEL